MVAEPPASLWTLQRFSPQGSRTDLSHPALYSEAVQADLHRPSHTYPLTCHSEDKKRTKSPRKAWSGKGFSPLMPFRFYHGSTWSAALATSRHHRSQIQCSAAAKPGSCLPRSHSNAHESPAICRMRSDLGCAESVDLPMRLEQASM